MPEKARALMDAQARRDSSRTDTFLTDTFLVGRPSALPPLRASRRAAAELALLVEEQIARGLAVLHGQRGQCVVFRVKPHHAPEIDGAEDIDVVHEMERTAPRCRFAPDSRKNHAAFFKPPPVSSNTSSREISILMPKFWLAFR